MNFPKLYKEIKTLGKFLTINNFKFFQRINLIILKQSITCELHNN